MAKKGADEKKKRTKPSALEYIGEISLSLSFDLICKKMVEFTSKVMEYEHCSIFIIDEDGQELYVKNTLQSEKKAKEFRIRIDSQKGLIPHAVRTKKTVYCPDVTKSARYVKLLDDIRSEFIVPLKVKEKVFGVINVESEKVDGFPPYNRKLFEMLASTASIAMENSRLFENLSSLKTFNENIVLSMEEGIILEDTKGIIRFANPRAEEMAKRKMSDLVGKHWTTIVPDEVKEKVILESEKRPKGIHSRYEAAVLSRDGTVIPVIVSARPLFEGKKFVGVLSVFTDISEMRRVEQEALRLKELQESILRSAPIGIFTTDREGNLTSSNAAMLWILGSPSENTLKKLNIFKLKASKEAGWDKLMRKVLVEGQSIDEETRQSPKWGKAAFIRLKCIPLFEGERITGLVGIAEDVTERKKVEEALLESEERYRNLFENSPIGKYRTTPDGRLLIANPALVHILGYSSFDELRERNLDKEAFMTPHQKGRFKELMEWEGEVKGFEDVWVRADGTNITILENAKTIRGGDGKIIFFEGTVEDITERKKVEEALRESESRYRGLFEDSPISLWEEDFSQVKQEIERLRKEGVADFESYFKAHEEDIEKCLSLIRVMDVNKATLKLFEAKKKEQLLTNLHAIVPRDSYDMFIQELLHIASGKTEFEWEGINLTLTGSPINIILHWSVAPGHEEILDRVFVSIEDISKRERAEEALRKSEELYRSLVQTSPDSITLADLNSRFIMVNQQALTLHRFRTEEEMMQRSGVDLIAPEDRGRAIRELSKILETGGMSGEYIAVRKDGTRFPAEIKASLIKDNRGNPTAILTILRDITERRNAEIELKESEKKYRTLFENVFDGVYKSTPDGKILMVNPAFVKMLGYASEDEVLSLHTHSLYCSAEERSILNKRIEEEGELRNVEIRLKRKDGKEIIFLENSHAVRDERGAILYFEGTLTDISERKRTEEKLSAIHSFSQELALSKDIMEIRSIVFECASKVLNFDDSTILLVDETKKELYIEGMSYEDNIGARRFSLDSDKGVTVWVARNGQPLIVPDVTKEKRYLPGLPGAASELSVPMKVKDKVIGVLDVESRTPDAFSQMDATLLSILANSAAVSLQNVRLLEKEHADALNMQKILAEKSSLLSQISKLFEVTNTVAKLGNLDGTLDSIVKAIEGSGTWRKAAISLKDERGYFVTSAFAGLTEDQCKSLADNPVSPDVAQVLFDPRARLSRSYYHPHGGPTIRALDTVTVLSDMPLEECVDWHPEDLLIIPFYDRGGEIQGYLCVDEPTDGKRPTEDSLKVLETFANTATVAMENARLLESQHLSTKRTESLLRQMTKLFEVSVTSTKLTNLQETLDTIVNAIKGIGAWGSALISLKDEKGFFNRCAFAGLTEEQARKLSENPISPEISKILFDEKMRISRSFYHPHDQPTSKALDIVSVYSDKPLEEYIDWHPEDLLVIPFYDKEGNITGYLNVDDPADGRRPSEDTIRILEIFANNASAAIENARLFTRAQKEIAERIKAEEELERRAAALSALYETSLEINAQPDLHSLIQAIVRRAASLVGSPTGALYLTSPEGDSLRLMVSHNLPEEYTGTVLRMGEGISGRVALSGIPLMVEDHRRWEGRASVFTDGPFRRVLGVPLKSRGEIIGVLNITDTEKTGLFSDEEVRLVSSFADQAAIAIENARLLQTEKESVRETEELLVQLSKLFEVSNTITTLASLQETLNTVVQAIVATGTWKCALISLRDQKGYYNRCAFAGMTPEEEERLRTTPLSPEMEKIIFDDRMLISRSYYHPHGGPTMRALDAVTVISRMPLEECVDWHPEDVLIIPFYDKNGAILGYLNVDEPTDGRRPTKESLKILETFANTVSVAIQNARLFEETTQKAEEMGTLFEASSVVSSTLSIDEVLRSVAEQMVRAIGVTSCVISDWKKEEGYIIAIAQYSTQEDLSDLELGRRYYLSDFPVTRKVLVEGASAIIHVADEKAEPAEIRLMQKQKQQSLLMLPLRVKDTIVGLVELSESRLERRFTEREIQLVTSIANQAAVAIENARLFEQEKRNVSQLASVNELTKKMTSTLNIREIADIVVEHIQKMYGLYSVELYVKDGDRLLLSACAGASTGCLEIGKFQPLMEGMVGWAARFGQTILANDVSKEERYIRNVLQETKSELCIPLRIQTEVVGILNLESDVFNAFEEEDVYILETLSGQIASSIKNAKLYQEIRDFSRMLQMRVDEKSARTEALLETTYALRETTSWEVGLNLIVEGIVKSLKFESAALMLINERTAILESKAVKGTMVNMANLKLPLSDPKPIAVRCIKERRPINIQDAAADPRVEVQVGTSVSSFCWVPILFQNETLGAIGVSNPESGIPISDEDVEVLVLYANAAALFIEKTRYLVSPAIEKVVSTQLKFRLPVMEGYLVFEEKAERAFEIFCDLITHGIQGFCVSRMAPDLIRKKYGLEKTPIMWLSHSSTKESIDPQDLGKMNHIITEFLHRAEDAAVLLEGLEYLITENDFPRVIKALHALSDAIVLTNARLIIPFNPKTLSEKELSILEREFNVFK